MSKNNKKVILAILFVLIVVVTAIGVSYAIFSWYREGKVNNTISTRNISCTFNEGIPISIESAFPIDDEVGKKLSTDSISGYKQGYYDSTLSCKCNGDCKGVYEIYATNISTEPKLNTEYVKTYVTDGEMLEKELNPVVLFSNLNTSTLDQSGKIVYQGSFSGSFSQKIRLRLWISDKYIVNGESETFKAKLNARVSEE